MKLASQFVTLQTFSKVFFSPVFLTRWCLPFKKKFVEILQGECSPCSLAQFVPHSPLRVTPSSGVAFGDWVAGNCGRCGFHTSRGVSGADVQEVQQRRRGQGSVAVCPRVPWCPLPGSLGLTAGCGGSPCQWPVMQDTSSADVLPHKPNRRPASTTALVEACRRVRTLCFMEAKTVRTGGSNARTEGLKAGSGRGRGRTEICLRRRLAEARGPTAGAGISLQVNLGAEAVVSSPGCRFSDDSAVIAAHGKGDT